MNLKLTSGKILSLSNVLHVPDMNYNLVSVSILSKAGIKTNFDLDKVLLSKCGGFVGKGFYSNGLFVLDVSKVMNDKCLICVEAKSTKKSCKPIEFREIELLGLIHSHIGDFHCKF